MSLTNRYGDFEITDPQALRALAHPVRLAALEHLQRHGPATATQLSAHVGATPSVVSWHLRHLASFGLVKDWDGATSKRERWWQAAARGFRFNLPDDPEGQAAARQLGAEMFARYAELPLRWLTDDEPRLDTRWRRAARTANTRIRVTAEELHEIEDAIEEVLARFVRRPESDAPAGARGVRILRYSMPEAGDETGTGTADDETGTGTADDETGTGTADDETGTGTADGTDRAADRGRRTDDGSRADDGRTEGSPR